MAAWGPPTSGAWATQVDEEEAENGGDLEPVPVPAVPAPSQALGGDSAFPSLGEAVGIKESKMDRKKKQTQKMTLGAFMAAGRKEPEIANLPTGPRERASDDDQKPGGLGGGFKNYGGDRGSYTDRGRDRDDEKGRHSEDMGPSRADAADDWGTKKAFVPSGSTRGSGFGDREDRYGGFGDKYTERRSGFGEGSSNRADEADRWGSKSFEPSRRGFDDKDRQSSFGSRDEEGPSRADKEDRWSRKVATSEPSTSRWGGSSSGPTSGSRPRLELKPRSADLPPLQPISRASSEASSSEAKETLVQPKTGPRPNPFGSAKPVDVKEKPEPSRDEQASTEEPIVVPQKPRSNPFGLARPREEVLREKGIDPEKLESDRLSLKHSGSDTKSESGQSHGEEEQKNRHETAASPAADASEGSRGKMPAAQVGPNLSEEPESDKENLEAKVEQLTVQSAPEKPSESKEAPSSWAKIASKAAPPPVQLDSDEKGL